MRRAGHKTGDTLAAVLAAALIMGVQTSPPARGQATQFHYDEKSAATATYFAALSNLANTVMFSGLGEDLVISPYERDDWLRRAGYVTRPRMPDMDIVGPLYAAGMPAFKQKPDFSKPETLGWKRDKFDRTLDPGAQAWALLKITSPQFHLQFHDLPSNKLAGLMMIPQARAQALILAKRLRNRQGLFARRAPDGAFQDAEPRDQAAVLWAVSSLISAATATGGFGADYWHRAYRDLVAGDRYRPLADAGFAAVKKLPPAAPGDRAIAIAALIRYAVVVKDTVIRREALRLARNHSDALAGVEAGNLENLGLAVFGLTQAARVFAGKAYAAAATSLFRDKLLALWDGKAGVFRNDVAAGPDAGTAPIVHTPRTIGAALAALNAMRWHGSGDLRDKAAALYPRFFETAIIRSGLLRASPLPLAADRYLKAERQENFSHPLLPAPETAGVAPVFTSEVIFEDGRWRVSDPMFRTKGAMFLANMLAIRSGTRSDIFLTDEAVRALHQGL